MSKVEKTYEVYIDRRWVKISLTDELLVSAKDLLDILKEYIGTCGNTGYAVTREQFQELYNKGKKLLLQIEEK